jgi:hypothetical protein
MRKLFIYTLAILITVATSENSFAGAGQDGNGGGVIKDGAHLKTMAEAGILLQRASNLASNLKYPDYFDLSEDTKNEVVKLVSLLPISPKGKENLVKQVIGNRTTFITSDEIDQTEYKKIVADYAATLKAYNHQLDESVFSLAAVTLDGQGPFQGHTLLLSSFSKLNPRQQASILIHERNFRYADEEALKDKRKLLGFILELDSQIYQLMKAKENGIVLDPMRTIAVLQDLNIAIEYNVAYNAIKILQNRSPNPILVEDFIIFDSVTTSTSMPVDPSLVKRLNKYDSRALQIFEKAELRMYTSADLAGALVILQPKKRLKMQSPESAIRFILK